VDIEELKKQAKKADEYFSRLQRLQAEFDNYRKRIKREEAGIRHRSIENLVEQLVEVLDVFDRALHEQSSADVPEAYRQGIELVHRILLDVLARKGLSRIDALGQPFDPNFHEAIAVQEDESIPDG